MSNNSGVSTDGLATVDFLTGVDSSGRLNTVTGWRWAGDTPATYTYSDGSAHKWDGGAAGTAGTAKYYFDPGSNWSAAEQATFKSALALWSAVADVTFTMVDTLAAADAVFYRQSSTTSPLPTDVTLDPGKTYLGATYTAGAPGAASLPATQSAYLSMDTNVDGWQDITSFTYWGGYAIGTVVHELGHLIGLIHAGPYNGTVNPALQQYNATDTTLWSLMSYIGPTDTKASYYASYPVTSTNWTINGTDYTPTSFMPLDILAAQRLYGAPAATPLNDVTFGFNCTIVGDCKPFFDFTVDTNPVITLYATGVANSLDVSGWSTPSTINLTPGTFSSVDGMANNLGIAYGTRIDTAFGGGGDDTFIVNDDADTIDGGGGVNTVIFSGTSASYAIGRATDGATTVTRGGVTDTLRNVQHVQFAEATIVTRAPTVASVGFSPTAGEAVTGASVNLTLNLSAPVTVAGGAPLLTLNDGGAAHYIGGSGSNALTFAYTVALGERTADLAVTGSVLNGATVNDSGGNTANLSGAVGAAASHLRITGALQAVDFGGNGSGNVLFRELVSGDLSDFLMTANQPTWASIGWADPALAVVGTGDFTGSGTDDILFRDPASGNLGDFVMSDGQPTWANIGWASPVLQVVGIGDFNGDDSSDILFRDPTGGGISMFAMHNNQPTWSYIGWADPSLQIAGVGDFNGDGTDDILFRDPVGGGIGDFVMQNGQASWAAVGWAAPAMQVVGIGKYNGAGATSDILLRDPVGGGFGDFVMTNNQPTWAAVGWASPSLYVAG